MTPKCASAAANPDTKGARAGAVMSTAQGTGGMLWCRLRSSAARGDSASQAPPCATQSSTARRHSSNCREAFPKAAKAEEARELQAIETALDDPAGLRSRVATSSGRNELAETRPLRNWRSNGVLSALSFTSSGHAQELPALFSLMMNEPSPATKPAKKARSGGLGGIRTRTHVPASFGRCYPEPFLSSIDSAACSWTRNPVHFPGEYSLYCSIHPVLMSQVVKVR